MKFVWFRGNREHVTRPGHLPDTETWERVYLDPDARELPVEGQAGRYIREAEIDGATYRIVFALTGPSEVFPITGHQISSRRRRSRS